MIDEAFVEARRNGWPLTKDDVLKERIEYEDRVRFKGRPVAEVPQDHYKDVPMQEWSATALYVLGKQVTRFAYSVVHP